MKKRDVLIGCSGIILGMLFCVAVVAIGMKVFPSAPSSGGGFGENYDGIISTATPSISMETKINSPTIDITPTAILTTTKTLKPSATVKPKPTLAPPLVSASKLFLYTKGYDEQLVRVQARVMLVNPNSNGITLMAGYNTCTVLTKYSFSDIYEGSWITVQGRVADVPILGCYITDAIILK